QPARRGAEMALFASFLPEQPRRADAAAQLLSGHAVAGAGGYAAGGGGRHRARCGGSPAAAVVARQGAGNHPNGATLRNQPFYWQKPLGTAQFAAASRGLRGAAAGHYHAAHALEYARCAEPRLHPHGAGQGAEPRPHRMAPRPAQCPEPGSHSRVGLAGVT
nr:hypothetical protein [Tanacetum cinerariifolium]